MKYLSYIAIAVSIIALVFALVGNDQPNTGADVYNTSYPHGLNITGSGCLAVDGSCIIDSSGNFDGAVTGTTGTFSGGIVTDISSITATTTLTSASDNYQFFGASSSATTVTLPAASDGLRYEFVVTGALTGGFTVIESAEGDNISGILMVNDADVVCSDEDQINIITDGEVIGDRVEIISDGTNWYILDSDADASGKMTCTDPS